MKLRDAASILKDMEHQELRTHDEFLDGSNILRYFSPDGEYHESLFRYSLANNIGERSLNDFVSFSSTTLFPGDGSWINWELDEEDERDLNKRQLKQSIEKAMKKKVTETNFYTEVPKFIKAGCLFNQATMDARYSLGISVHANIGNDLIVSEAKGDCARAYAKCSTTNGELMVGYEGLPERFEASDAMDKMNEEVTVIRCILPNNELFFEEPQKSDNKFVDVYILLPDNVVITKKNESKTAGYKSWPVMEFRPHTDTSLCREALVSTAFADHYSKISRDRAEQVLYPAIAADVNNVRNRSLNVSTGGITPIQSGDVIPTAIHSLTGGDPVNDKNIQVLEQVVKQTFKIDMIIALQTQGLNQMEEHALNAKILKALSPVLGPLSNNFTAGLLNRLHNLCLANDKEYKKKFSALSGGFAGGGLDKIIEKSERIVKVNQVMQMAAGSAQFWPEFKEIFDPTLIAVGIADSLDLMDAVRPVKVIEQRAAEKAQMQKDQEGAQNDKTMSEAGLNQAKAKSEEGDKS